MASYVTSAGAAHILACMFGKSNTPHQYYYVALMRSSPDPGSTGEDLDEPLAQDGYQRAAIGNYSTNWAPSGNYEMFNAVPIVWPQVPPGSDWGHLTHYGLLETPDALTGTLFLYGALNPTMTPAPLSVVRARVGQLAITAASLTPSFQPT